MLSTHSNLYEVIFFLLNTKEDYFEEYRQPNRLYAPLTAIV